MAKNVFRVHRVDSRGKTVVQRELRRRQVLSLIARLQPCLLGMEACGGAHYWAREMVKLGHEVRLMSPRFARRYVKSNKNDAKDAEVICEAVGWPSTRFVGIKSQAQQDMVALHRVRSLLILPALRFPAIHKVESAGYFALVKRWWFPSFEHGELGQRQGAETATRPAVIVVVAPCVDGLACFGER